MGLGPVFAREMLVASRRGRTFSHRASVAGLVLLLILGVFGWLTWWLPQPVSFRDTATVARIGFGMLVLVHGLLTLSLMPELVGRSLAEEKERGTLGLLLASQVTSLEIVLGKLAAGLIQFCALVASGLPVAIVLPFLGGLDPALVLWAYGGMASTAFLLGTLSILTALYARSTRTAITSTFVIAMFWVVVPFFVTLVGSRFLGLAYAWIAPVNSWLLASGPLGVMLVAMGIMGRSNLPEAVAWMVALELAGGSVILAWSVVHLRGAVRAGADGGSRALGHWTARLWRRRPPCGDDPVLWKEKYVSSQHPVSRIANALATVALALILTVVLVSMSRPAFRELREHGYGFPAYDVERRALNQVVRTLSVGFTLCFGLLVAGMAVESITNERTRDTWAGLLATPLSGAEILRGKRRGVLWRLRWGVFMLAAMWAVGLAAGAVHPVGVLAAGVAFAVSTAFVIALGTDVGCRLKVPARASSVVLLVVLGMSLSMLLSSLPGLEWRITAAGISAPLLAWLSLVSYRDLHDLAAGVIPGFLKEAHVTSAGTGILLATYCVGLLFWVGGTVLLVRLGSAQFDAFVGRPCRCQARSRPVVEQGASDPRASETPSPCSHPDPVALT